PAFAALTSGGELYPSATRGGSRSSRFQHPQLGARASHPERLRPFQDRAGPGKENGRFHRRPRRGHTATPPCRYRTRTATCLAPRNGRSKVRQKNKLSGIPARTSLGAAVVARDRAELDQIAYSSTYT